MDIVEQMRSFESDHEPDGWPAIQMKQVSALCDEIERLNSAWQVETLNRKDLLIAKQEAENDRLKAESARLQSIIDEANAQEPVAIFCSLSPHNFRWVSGGYLCEAKHGDRLYANPIPAQPSPRITEQDAREIEDFLVEDYKREYVGQGIEAWLRSACRELLTKLNEAKHD